MAHIIELAEDLDSSYLNRSTSEVDIKRTVKLIKEALDRDQNPRSNGTWCVIRSVNGQRTYLVPRIYEPTTFLRQDKNLWIVGATERAKEYPIAIFPGDLNSAAKYFVWLVSEGRVSIDWSLYLEDIEPKQSLLGKLFGAKK